MKFHIECTVHQLKRIAKAVNNNQFQLIAKVAAPIDQAGKPLGQDDFFCVFVKDRSMEQDLYNRIVTMVKTNPAQRFKLECFLNGRRYEKDAKEFYANNIALNNITPL
jgi:hypothetical protein